MSEPQDIRDRTLDYALRAVRLYRAVQGGDDRAGWIIGKQYLRAATSIGANVAEAQAAESPADFIHKYSLAQKEAREGLYWLRLFDRSGIIAAERLGDLIGETEEIIAIITTILVRAKAARAERAGNA
ncbi:MAG: four helix bundle protein [Candidatus Brocadiia bacterium]